MNTNSKNNDTVAPAIRSSYTTVDILFKASIQHLSHGLPHSID